MCVHTSRSKRRRRGLQYQYGWISTVYDDVVGGISSAPKTSISVRAANRGIEGIYCGIKVLQDMRHSEKG